MRIRGAVVFEGAGAGVDSDRAEGVGAGEEDSAVLGFRVCAADRDVAVAIVVGDVGHADVLSYDTSVSTPQTYGNAKTMLQRMLQIAIKEDGETAPVTRRLREQIYEMDLRAERNQQAMFHVGGVKANQEGQKADQGGARRSSSTRRSNRHARAGRYLHECC